MKIIIRGLNKEKGDLEELIFKQETKVSDLAAKIKTVEKNIKEKNKEIKDNEENYLRLIEIIEEQKKQIESLTKSNMDKEIEMETPSPTNKAILSTKDELQIKKQLAEKDNEISTIKIFNDNLKIDILCK